LWYRSCGICRATKTETQANARNNQPRQCDRAEMQVSFLFLMENLSAISPVLFD
jgi:hypothetical protein